MAASKVSGRKLKLAVPDLISNSYFPAAAAVELGFFAREGLDVSLELIFPVSKCYEALRDAAVESWRAVCLNPEKIRSICAAPYLNERG